MGKTTKSKRILPSISISICFLLFLASCATQPPVKTPLSAQEVFEKVSPAIAYVETLASSGSGVLIPNGWIVTNAHVVWPFRTARVTFPDGTELEELPVAYIDLMVDIALLGPLQTEKIPIKLNTDGLPVTGSDVYLIGYPAETERIPEPTIARGIVSRYREWESQNITYIQTDSAIAGGQSGGVLTDVFGEVIGISSLMIGENNFALAQSAQDVKARVDSLLRGEERSGLGERLYYPQGEAEKTHVFQLRDDWEVAEFFFWGEMSKPIIVSAESEKDISLWITDSFGNEIAYADDSFTGSESINATVRIEGPHIATVFLLAHEPGEVTIESDIPLIRRIDKDEGRSIAPGEELFGMVDHPHDFDLYTIDLEEGQTVTIEVDSIMIDPYLSFDTLGASISLEDDDSFGGLLGLNAGLTVRSTENATYIIVGDQSHQSYLTFGGGYIIRVNPASERNLTSALQVPEALQTQVATESFPSGELDPELVGSWEYFSLRPEGWVEDTEFFRATFGEFGPNVLFGGGLPGSGGYDPNISLSSYPYPRNTTFEMLVEANLSELKQYDAVIQKIQDITVAEIPSKRVGLDFGYYKISQTYLIHRNRFLVIQCAASSEELLKGCQEVTATLILPGSSKPGIRQQVQTIFAKSVEAYQNNDVVESIDLATEAAELAEDQFGIDDSLTFTMYFYLAKLHIDSNDFIAARDTLFKTLNSTPPDEKATKEYAKELNNVSWELRESDTASTVLPLIQRCIDVSEEMYGPNHRRTLGRRHTFAIVHYWQGNLLKAEKSLRLLIDDFDEIYDESDSIFPGYLYDFSVVLRKLNKENEAKAVEERIRELDMELPEWVIKE